MTVRPFFFWLHLASGLIAGLSIGIMCFTGTMLAFEKELVAWSERELRRVEPPSPDAARLSLDGMRSSLLRAHPDARPASMVVQRDPGSAVAFTSGRSGAYYVNPYTGEVRQAVAGRMSAFMRTMTDLHRTLGFHGETSRPVGKLINGVCNLAYCVLALTGLYLWLPRSGSWRSIRAVIWFRRTGSGRARDFNWHNAIGLWTAPVVVVLTLTAVPISFRWGGEFIYWITGTPAPTAEGRGAGGGPGGQAAPVVLSAPAAGAVPMSSDQLIEAVQQLEPNWKTVTLRLANAGLGGPGVRGGRGGREERGNSEREPGEAKPSSPPSPQAAVFTVRSSVSWPRTANTTLQLDPFTGKVVRRTGHEDLNAAQRVRSWTRFLHTGEALGAVGQAIAGIACLGGVVLVYTGFALSWRRFFSRKTEVAPAPGDS
ncbi:MAG: PepSY-associated TM helix domain-containing protein [Opitutaceae bacterium]